MKYFLLFGFSVILNFCTKGKEDVTKKNVTPEMKTVVVHQKSARFNEEVLVEIDEWEEYVEFNKFLQRFDEITPKEALSNTPRLKELVKEMSNSLYREQNFKIKQLTSNAFKARVNVLENEILRLDDMVSIPSITAKDVNYQVNKIYELYSGVITKINWLFKQREYTDEIKLEDYFNEEYLKLMNSKSSVD